MNLEYLQTYLEVVKRGNFSHAAKRLGVTQPGITQQIQKLEKDLGVSLLDRSERRCSMTTAGMEFYKFATKVVAEEAQLQDRIHGLASNVSGKLVLAASTVPGEYILPGLLSDFVKNYPDVEASVEIGDTEAVANMIINAECDLGFLGSKIVKRTLRQKIFVDDELVLIVPSTHRLAYCDMVSLSQIEGEKLITREKGSGTMQSVKRIMQKAGFDSKRWQHVTVFGSTQAVISAVEAGLGIAFVSGFAAHNSIQSGRIVALRVEGVPLKRALYITFLDKSLTTLLHNKFLSFSLDWVRNWTGKDVIQT